MDLEIKSTIQIAAKPDEVYQAIIDPGKMSNYFIAEGSAPMETGKTVIWKFPEFEERFNIQVVKAKPSEVIAFEWEGAPGKLTQVTIIISEKDNMSVVKVTEGTMEADERGIKWYGENTGGWANFLACLKAYLEHGINLRKGAFDYMKPS